MKTILKKLTTTTFIFLNVFCSGESSSNDSDILNLLLFRQNSESASASSSNNRAFRYIFVTADAHNGNFGGISGADAFCGTQTPTGLGTTGSFKALMISQNGGGENTRIASLNADANFNGQGNGQVNWILKADTDYRRIDGTTVVFRTNGRRLFDFNPANSLQNSFTTTVGTRIWTALNPDWSATNSCGDWFSADAGNQGETGLPNERDVQSIHIGTINCNTTARVLCIEQ
ncbi:DUF1554 domain-containing protein [Leptospira sp. 201903070]|uniref:DUF1554 domain-containing protein n=1 Tax=Leptospira ainlahdjerensis TaxID=2810033 RepID=A0ABS2UBL1_9LEPT|nr:DUF1554 domain-containing protein [Leptospira ainlahdjerensis]MBM9577673.1 DUF1554 domain-containing protein [Leptospira ainlahdjerensis]MBM9577747.1 DUF1554 domain-containing protein [Leptospira ainlahdjerensis]